MDSLRPKSDECDQPLETPPDYCARVRQTLPNFPDAVVLQWFFDHPSAVETNEWLDYPRLSFELRSVRMDELKQPCFAEHPTIVQYRRHFEAANTSGRMARIHEHVLAHGTWPVPPLVLSNATPGLRTPSRLVCDSPYHLLEGHHRFAVLFAESPARLADDHLVWLATLTGSKAQP